MGVPPMELKKSPLAETAMLRFKIINCQKPEPYARVPELPKKFH